MNNVIKINIKRKEDYISKFNEEILSNELSYYIMEECRGYDLKSNIRIEITSEYNMDSIEKEKIVNMIRENFNMEIIEMSLQRKRNIILDLSILGFGAIFLIFYLLSSNIPILSEFILIFSWVLIWEGANNLIFTSFRNKIDIIRKKKIANCKILFKEKI